MPIKHNLTDRASNKARTTLYVYIIVFIAIVTIPFLLNNQKENGNKTEKESKKRYTLCIEGEVDGTYTEILDQYSNDNDLAQGVKDVDCSVTIARNVKNINNYIRLSNRIYVIVGRYDNTIQNITTQDLQSILTTQQYKGSSVIWDEQTDQFLKSTFDNIGVGQRVVSKEEVVKRLEKENNTLAIIPFEEITHKYSIVTIDNLTPLDKEFNTLRYPLIDRYWIKGIEDIREKLSSKILQEIPESNYNSTNIKTLLLTGSSAIGSGIQQQLYNNKQLNYISPTLQNIISSADIAQINNEASISTPCIQSENTSKYCSTPENIEIIKDLGFDVVGVNGNHIMDISYESYIETLQWYSKNNIKYYAGGTSQADALKPKIVEINKLRFSFIGFNFLYPFSYYASKTTAGSANVDMKIMEETIKNAKKESEVVIVDMGWGYESEERLLPYQIEYANKALEFGANIVIGTNSRQVQKIELHNNGNMIFYGLGAFLPHTYQDAQSAIYILTYYNDKPINISIKPISNINGTIDLAPISQLDTILKKVYSSIEIK